MGGSTARGAAGTLPVRPTSSEEADAGSARGAAMGTGLRICSLLPSATEIVFSLGLGDRLVAVTHECDYPDETRRLPAITRSIMPHTTGGSREIHSHISRALHSGSSIYALDQSLLAELKPDL